MILIRMTKKCTCKRVNIAGILVRPSTTVKNLGIIFDSSLSFLPHISSLTKSAFFHLRNITCLRPLNISDAETLVHAFITSRSHFFKEIFSHYSHPTQTSLATCSFSYSIQDSPPHLQSTTWSLHYNIYFAFLFL